MRFVFGIVIGALLLLGAAYVHDASIDPARNASARALVNWDVVSDDLRGLTDWLHDQWDWLSDRLQRGR